MPQNKFITPIQYAQSRGISLSAVTKMIRTTGKLPGIKTITKMGRFYLLTPSKSYYNKKQ